MKLKQRNQHNHQYESEHEILTVGFHLLRIHLYVLLSPYLCFISFFYLNWCVLGDDALISLGSFMQTKHLCVLIYIRIKGEVSAVKHV